MNADDVPFGRLADALPNIVLLRDETGGVTGVNRAWSAYSGLTAEQSRGDGWLAILHPADVDRHRVTRSEAIARGEQSDVRLRLRRASDGAYRWFTAHTMPVRSDDGSVIGWIESWTDVHDFKLASEKLSVLDHLGHMMAIRDADDCLEYVSPSWAQFVGTTEALSLNRRRQDFVHPDDLHLVEELARASHAAPREIVQNEVRVRGADNTYRWFLTRSIVLPASAETPKRRLNTLTDIDDLKRQHAALATSAAELAHRAHHDPLTKLANRARLIERLRQLIDEATTVGTGIVVLYLDIDRFKTINDTLGHNAGDVLLIETAARINSAIRVQDIASRFGGDEFVLACAPADARDATEIARRIQTAVRAPLQLAGQSIVVSCSIGMSIFPHNGVETADLIQHADAAMYTAKQSGRGTWRIYTPQMRAPSRN